MSKKIIAIYCLYDEQGIIHYIGKTKNLKNRFFRSHIRNMNWVVGIRVLEWTTEKQELKKEKEWISKFPPEQLRNKNQGGGGSSTLSLEHRIKIAITSTIRTMSPEAREKIRLANLGKKHSKKTIEKIKEAIKREDPENHKNRMEALRQKSLGNSYRLGKSHSEETKRKIGLKSLGRTWSKEQIEKRRQTIKLKNNGRIIHICKKK